MPASTTADGAGSPAARKPPAVVVDDGWVDDDLPLRTAPVSSVSARAASPAGTRESTGRFPRSAAERAGATSSGSAPAKGGGLPPRPAAVPARPTLPHVVATGASPESVERPVQLAHGSITAPLPEETRRKRPPTVEFPTIESEMMEMMEPPAVHLPAPAAESKPLPSIFTVIDRRRAPLGTAPPALGSIAPPLAQRARADEEAVPEPIVHETAAPGLAPAGERASELAAVRSAVRPGPNPTAAARPKRPGSFSEAERAFFAAGEELERVGQDSLADDDLEDEAATARRPTLWRRLTGRRGSL